MKKATKNYKIIATLLLVRECDLNVLHTSIMKNFRMSEPQVVYFLDSLIHEYQLIEFDEKQYKLVLTDMGKDYLDDNGLKNRTIESINSSVPMIDENFYFNYFKK